MKNAKNILIISVPFVSFMLPSQQVASISGYLKINGYDVQSEFPSYEYRNFLGEDAYNYIVNNNIGNLLFGKLLCDDLSNINDSLSEYDILNKTKDFIDNFISKIEPYAPEYVIFHIQYSQFIPALYFAKQLYIRTNSRIIFSGFHCKDELGINLKKIFPFLDKTIGNNFEEEILAYISHTPICFHETLDFLPTPDYEPAYNALVDLKNNGVPINLSSIGFLVEFSRGCKWEKCIFCTLNCHTNSFRVRTKEKISDDYKTLREKYRTNVIIPEHFTMSDDWETQISGITSFTKTTSKNFVLNFKVSDLQDELKFKTLKNSGASILVGTESFSVDYLSKLNKGQRVIENIQTLKYAERWDIPCFHNVMYGLPFENKSHFEENRKNFQYIYHLQPPFDVEKFRLTYGSHIYNNSDKYGISKICKQESIFECFTDLITKDYIPFFYDFECEVETPISALKWEAIVDEWRSAYYSFQNSSEPQRDKLLIKSYYEGVFQIVDHRRGFMEVYNLSKDEKKIYDYIDKIRNISDIYLSFPNYKIEYINSILERFLELKIAFKEDNLFLGLAL